MKRRARGGSLRSTCSPADGDVMLCHRTRGHQRCDVGYRLSAPEMHAIQQAIQGLCADKLGRRRSPRYPISKEVNRELRRHRFRARCHMCGRSLSFVATCEHFAIVGVNCTVDMLNLRRGSWAGAGA